MILLPWLKKMVLSFKFNIGRIKHLIYWSIDKFNIGRIKHLIYWSIDYSSCISIKFMENYFKWKNDNKYLQI